MIRRDKPFQLTKFVPDFLPADQCGRCHEGPYQAWRDQKHTRAAATLQARNRLVPECLTCHSESFRRTGTFVWKDNLIDGVQCSTCHGEGVLHRLLANRRHITRSVGANKVPESSLQAGNPAKASTPGKALTPRAYLKGIALRPRGPRPTGRIRPPGPAEVHLRPPVR